MSTDPIRDSQHALLQEPAIKVAKDLAQLAPKAKDLMTV